METASLIIHGVLDYFYQCSAKFSFQATGCFPTQTIIKIVVRSDESYHNDYHQSLEKNWPSTSIEQVSSRLRVSMELRVKVAHS